MRKRSDRNNVNIEKTYLTAAELAKTLSVGENTARAVGVQAGALIKIGRCTRYNREAVMSYLRDKAE